VKKSIIKLLDCFFLLRIPLLAPVWTILILGWITGNRDAKVGGILSSAACSAGNEGYLWIALTGFSLLVASIYVVNQIADIESDRINHKLFLLPQGLVSVRTAWVLACACCAGGLAISFLFPIIVTVIFIVSLVLGVLYNLPPASLKNHAWGGVVANFFGHGMCTYLVGWVAAHVACTGEAISWSQGLISSLAPGFANAAVYIATTIPDADGDKATGKKTFCVAFGPKRTAIAALCFCAGALATSFFMEHNAWLMIITAAISLVLFIWLAVSTEKRLAFQSFKWPVFLLTAFVAVMVPAYAVLILATFYGSRLYYKRRFGIDYPTFKSQ
jgi:4-hydroxybenzoate polyprenyltransferase